MKNRMFYVDFNEMLEEDLVLFSRTDIKLDSDGNPFPLHAGMVVDVFMDDLDSQGKSDPLLARGALEISDSNSWSSHVEWCCRINAGGIRHQSGVET